ncbi:MAG: sporulation transcription factor Spo0A [Christensenellales bacterium]
MDKFKLMIIDSKEDGEMLSQKVQVAEQIEVTDVVVDGEEAVEIASSTKPDIIVLDVVLSKVDGFELISKIKAELPNCKFIITSCLNSSFYINKAMEIGVDYFMIKPIDGSVLAKRVVELCSSAKQSGQSDERRLEEKITNIFITVGIPAHIKGYQFLREAIKMAVRDPQVINSITKKLYPSIAEVYETSASKVERAIRHAIEVAWNKGKIENINDVFGLKVYDTHEKPTNGEFIALVADKMLLEN